MKIDYQLPQNHKEIKRHMDNKIIDHTSDFQSKNIPLISVIIPTYNRPKLLSRAIQSVLTQDVENFEVIVINDSGYDVVDIIKKLDDDRIVYKQHSENRGLAEARNTGLKYAKGKYITYLDDDDLYYENHLSTLASFLENNPVYQVAYTDAFTSIQENLNGEYVETKKELRYSFDFNYDRILYENFIPVLCIMHRKDCIDHVGTFDPILKRTEDWDLWIRMSRVFKFAHINKTTCKFRWVEDGKTMSSNHDKDRLIWIFAELNIFHKHLSEIEAKPRISKIIQPRVESFLKEIRDNLFAKLSSNDLVDIHKDFGFPNLNSVLNRFLFLQGQYGPHYQTQFNEVLGILIIANNDNQLNESIIKAIIGKILGLEKNIGDYQIKLAEHNTQIRERDQAIQNLKAKVSERDQSIQYLNKNLNESEKAINNLNTRLVEHEQEILFYAASKSWAITRPLRKLQKLINKIFRRVL
jgi:glycosyltransferase involved in cell wall biosynthesis